MSTSQTEYDTYLVHKACALWMKVIQNQNEDYNDGYSVKDLMLFAEFLGHPYGEHRTKIVPTTDPEVRHLIDLINGPNGNAILKMLEIRNNEKNI